MGETTFNSTRTDFFHFQSSANWRWLEWHHLRPFIKFQASSLWRHKGFTKRFPPYTVAAPKRLVNRLWCIKTVDLPFKYACLCDSQGSLFIWWKERQLCVCVCVLTKALIFLSIWFYCNKQQDAPSVTVMGSAMREVTSSSNYDTLWLLLTMLDESLLHL